MSQKRICVLKLYRKYNSKNIQCSIHFSHLNPIDWVGMLLMQIVVLITQSPEFFNELCQLIKKFQLNDNEEDV